MSATVLAALLLTVISVPAQASVAVKPTPPAGAERVESFKPDLDKDRRRERVLVYSLAAEGFPTSYFEVWNRAGGDWSRVQSEAVNETPSSDPESGFVKAWVADLNRDGRDEIAVRDFITPSVGEVLSIFRQTTKTSLHFSDLQTIGGDQTAVRPKKREAATLAILIKSNHSVDGVEHHERWTWAPATDQWQCSEDCGGRPARADAVPGDGTAPSPKIIPSWGSWARSWE